MLLAKSVNKKLLGEVHVGMYHASEYLFGQENKVNQNKSKIEVK